MSAKPLTVVDGFIRNQTPYLQGSIVLADTKASFLLALIGVFLAYLESRQPLVERVAIFLGQRGWESVSAGLALSAASLLFLGGCFSVLAVYPRFNRKAAQGSSAFIEISSAYSSSEDFANKMLDRDEEEVIRQQLRAHHYRCRVCTRKWHFMAFAYALSISGMVVFLVHFVLVVCRVLKAVP
jgi:hypothetical protein